MAEPKVRPEFKLEDAESVAGAVFRLLEPHVKRLMIVGSLRRKRSIVHDVDIVVEPHPGDEGRVRLAAAILDSGVADYQALTAPAKIWKFQSASIPVELYLATPETWAGLLVVRTGSKESNVRMAMEARRRGMRWHADGRGVEHADGSIKVPASEREVFELIGIPYLEPAQRG